MAVPSRRHSAVAVDLHRVVLLARRLIQEKVRKECPCVVSGSARCTTLRDKDEVCVFLCETQTMCFVTRAMQVHGGQCVTVHYDNK